MSQALRPVLRSSTLPSLPSSQTSTTYICQSCRHARLLKRPKRPYTFTQLVTLSDGSAYMMRTTSPVPVFRSSRDTRNAPLWNPNSKDVLNIEDDEAGRLAGFRARFGRTFDAGKDTGAGEEVTAHTTQDSDAPASEKKAVVTPKKSSKETTEQDDLEAMFAEEDDAHMLDMISKFGQTEHQGSASQIVRKKL